MRRVIVITTTLALGVGFSVASGPLQFRPHGGGASVCTSTANGERVVVGDFFTAPSVGVTITDVHLTGADGVVLDGSWAGPVEELHVGAVAYDPVAWKDRPVAAGMKLDPGEEVNIVGLLRRTSDGAGRVRAMVVDYSIAGIPFTEPLGIDFTLKDSCF